MLSSAEFVQFILNSSSEPAPPADKPSEGALPEGFEGFEDGARHPAAEENDAATFARRLLEAAGFGYPELVQRASVIRSSDAVARHLPERVSYWQKTTARPYHTLLFETSLTHRELLAIPAFKGRALSHLDIVEDALARLVSEALEGFQRGGEGVTADVRKGRKDETLCVVSIVDGREGEPVRLVCFGTQNKSKEGGLETFQITEQTRSWDAQLAREHLSLLYERQFKKLEGYDWQEAFTTTEERKQAGDLLEVCTRRAPTEKEIQESVLDLLDTIAKSFGIGKRRGVPRRLEAFELPSDHDIGIDPEGREGDFGGSNPFGGVTLRDQGSHLLGYIVYPLRAKADAARLRSHLEEHNRFHNVLVVYPDEEQARLELWQGRDELAGRLRKGHGYRDAADVVNLLSRFFIVSRAKVRNPAELAQELAYRARYLQRLAVRQLAEEPDEGPLRDLFAAFKEALVHDQTEQTFADAFAQTVTNGMLAARWAGNERIQKDGLRFTRSVARDLVPTTNPFLREFFRSVLGVKLEERRGRFLWLVDDIAGLLDRVDVTYVFGAGDATGDVASDPVIHFYEPFLEAYDPKVKKERGVFYTPRPVVAYIVRSVDGLLRTEFGLADGLADTATWAEMARRHPDLTIPAGIPPGQEFVRILDPAAGTGTFLVEIIDTIHRTLVARWTAEGHGRDSLDALWNEYVPRHLLPRLHGFELLMAPYAIAHLKVGLKLAETGYRFGSEERARIYLTNSLELPEDASEKLAFAVPALAHEAHAVNQIKRHQRFTVVLGNPPYANVGKLNQTAWILGLLKTYKDGLAEKKLNLNDDFIKFFRYAHWTLLQATVGVLGFITGHAFLSGVTHRRMRKTLLTDFPLVRIVNLHGNVNLQERSPDGSVDDNVFLIRTGVAISLLSRAPTPRPPGQISYADLWGARHSKFSQLRSGAIAFTPLHIAEDDELSLFVPHDSSLSDEYGGFPSISDLFFEAGLGIQTKQDYVAINPTRAGLTEVVEAFRTMSVSALAKRFDIEPVRPSWSIASAKEDVQKHKGRPIPIFIRPFDRQWTYLTGRTNGFLARPRRESTQHLLSGTPSLVVKRQSKEAEFSNAWVVDAPINEGFFSIDPKGRESVFPLTLCEAEKQKDLTPTPKFNLKAKYVVESPETTFAYVYAVLFSPTYRKRYQDQLRTEFPRVPFTPDRELRGILASLGADLIACHLLDERYPGASWNRGAATSPFLSPDLPLGGSGPLLVQRQEVAHREGRVFIGANRWFEGVPFEVWSFRGGGYRICEKWLKSRHGRVLTKQDTCTFGKVVIALRETLKLMREVDEAIRGKGGWMRMLEKPHEAPAEPKESTGEAR